MAGKNDSPPYFVLLPLGGGPCAGPGGGSDDESGIGDDAPLIPPAPPASPVSALPARRRRVPKEVWACLAYTAIGVACVLLLLAAWMHYPLKRTCDRPVRERANRTFPPLSFNQSELTLFDISVIASHNSYHRASWVPFIVQWAYTNPSITALLDKGVMSFGLDLHLVDDVWYVYHLPIIDSGSTVTCLTDALEEIAVWSDRHPGYPPIRISFEPKYVIDYNNFCKNGPTETLFPRLQALIVDVLGPGRVVLPSELQGNYTSLLHAVQMRGWPTLRTLRGRVLLTLDLHEENKDCGRLFRSMPYEDRIMLIEYGFRTIRFDKPPDGIVANIDCCEPWLNVNLDLIIVQNVLVRELAALSGMDYGQEIVWLGLHMGFHEITTDHAIERTSRFLNRIPEIRPPWIRCNAVTTSPVASTGRKLCVQEDLIALFDLPPVRPQPK